jgi:tRNA A-37 threonylcarbamoyl transferase component Bud32
MRTDVELPERYQLVRRIARGGMATVWCARDLTLERKVAVKVMADSYSHDELAVRRFKREARTAARLSGHRHVVTIYDVGQGEASDQAPFGRPFIVMEYLSGGTVADAVRVEEVGRARALRWIAEAAAALDYAHSRGVVHRDVKLSNFLLDAERVLHVADFGIAQASTEETLTGTGQVLGTAAYLAPERALGQPATAASDRYALAIAAYELLVGERPFTAAHFAALARAQIEDSPPHASDRNPELPRALDSVLARGLAKRPEVRFATSRELAAAIVQALSAPRRRVPAKSAAAALGAGDRSGTRAVSYGAPGWRRLPALAAVALAALAVAIVAVIGHQAGRQTARTSDRTPAAHTRASGPRPVAASASNPVSPANATQLEARGHQLMVTGDYAAAIPVLRQAVRTAAASSLTYAYALYDLGRSLRLAGDPGAAVPILWRRLRIPNQEDVVKAELLLALRELGRGAPDGGD